MKMQRSVLAGNKGTLLLFFFWVAAAALSLSPVTSHATIFWDDEMEPGNSGYSLVSGAMAYDTAVKFSGNGSTRLDYTSLCYPDANAQANCGGFMDRTFTATGTFYRRFYIRLSQGFTVSDVFTKLMRSDTTGLTSNWWTLGCCGSKQMEVHDQNVPMGTTTVNFTNFTMQDATWYCVETYEQLNTPGVANGIQQAWVNGTQVLSQTNIMFRQSGDNSLYNNNRLYRQTGLGSIWFDRVAVGDTRIGCSGVSSQSDTTPPLIPSGLTVR
jgi:hypothetical protein